jgi:hypothetical protein
MAGMNPELIAALNRLADAHALFAANVGRLADALTHTEGKMTDLTTADALVEKLGHISSAISEVAENLSGKGS